MRDNILFGEPFDEKAYNNVVRVCALETDLAQWPHGDRTLVGEKGVALSGGQRARVTLARAVYRWVHSPHLEFKQQHSILDIEWFFFILWTIQINIH